MERAIDSTAKALANFGQHVTSSGKDQGLTKNFQMLIKMIGEAKTKHVSIKRVVVVIFIALIIGVGSTERFNGPYSLCNCSDL